MVSNFQVIKLLYTYHGPNRILNTLRLFKIRILMKQYYHFCFINGQKLRQRKFKWLAPSQLVSWVIWMWNQAIWPQAHAFNSPPSSVLPHVSSSLMPNPFIYLMIINGVFFMFPLEKGMATHSSILAWRIPWTEEPGGLQSIGLQRVRQDWAQLCSR